MRFEHPGLLLILVLIPALALLIRQPSRRPAAVLWVRTAFPGRARIGAFALRLVELLPWLAIATSRDCD